MSEDCIIFQIYFEWSVNCLEETAVWRHWADTTETVGRDYGETVLTWRDWGEMRVEYGETGRETAV